MLVFSVNGGAILLFHIKGRANDKATPTAQRRFLEWGFGIMKCYPERKDSQLDWVGEIPEHWQVFKFRYLSQESRRKNDDDANREMLSLSSYTGVQLKHYEYESTKRSKDESLTYLVVEPNQLVVNPMWQMKRSIGVSYLHGIVSPGYRVYYVDLERLVPQYLHHLMRSDNYVDEYNKHVRGITTYDRSVKKEDFEQIGVLLPPKHEQTQIANFLDRKTQQIDELIRAKERKIKLLQEYRASLIQQAVTKGLDANVEMKQSGLEWIGKIPKHWKVRKLKYIAKIVPSYVDKLIYPDEIPVSLCNYTDVYYNDYITIDTILAKGSCNQSEYSRSFLRKEDIIITSDSETPDDIGVPAYVKDNLDNVVCGYHLAIIKSITCLGEFVFRFIQSNSTKEYFGLNSNGITRYSLKKASIENLLVPLPTESEQFQIAHFLNRKTRQIDELRSNEEQTIKLLKEYRQSLISAVVTGKIDVRNEV